MEWAMTNCLLDAKKASPKGNAEMEKVDIDRLCTRKDAKSRQCELNGVIRHFVIGRGSLQPKKRG